MKAINILKNELEKLNKKISSLELERDELIKALEILDPKPVENMIGICLFEDTEKFLTIDNVTGYHINKNPNVSEHMKDMMKNKVKMFIFDDSKTPAQKEVLNKFHEYYKVPFLGDIQNGK